MFNILYHVDVFLGDTTGHVAGLEQHCVVVTASLAYIRKVHSEQNKLFFQPRY